MATEPNSNAGFALPTPVGASASAEAASASTGAEAGSMALLPDSAVSNTSSRDLLIGGAVLLVLFVAFFFAKNAYANGLVSKRLPPNKANASGWWLFVFLATLATGVVLVSVNAAKFMAPTVLGPIVAVALVALTLTLTSSRK